MNLNLNDGKKKTIKTKDMVMKVDGEISNPNVKTIVKSTVGSVKEEVSNHHGKRKSSDMVKAHYSNQRTPKSATDLFDEKIANPI